MTALHDLREHGQSPWVDFLSRRFIHDGDLAGLIEQGLVGITSNPTIFEAAIAEGSAYDEQFAQVMRDQSDPKEVFLALAGRDVRDACDRLSATWHAGDTDTSRDGWVSLEVDPRLAHDTAATSDEAIRLHKLIDRPNLFVKIPGTAEGLPAIEEAIARGIPVNVTLLFSLQRHHDAAQAYLRGLHRLREAGGDLRTVASVASFFISRVDTETDRRLDAIGGHDHLKGKLAIANAKLAYQQYQSIFTGPEWDQLVAAGASPQRCLWASTSVKNPAYRDVLYVEQLIGANTVNTMPRDTIEAFLDHGEVADTLTADLDAAGDIVDQIAAAGVDYDDVTATLERDGIAKFADSFQQLFDGIAAKRDALAGRR